MDQGKQEEAINADAITEILLRLPAKSGSRFRCVSKAWLSLLSGPLFIRAHVEAATAAPSGFCLFEQDLGHAEFYSMDGGGGGHPDPTLSFLDYRGITPKPVDSCNGLLLCRLPLKLESEAYVMSVCNPTTREHAVIPVPRDIGPEIMRGYLHLAFDPRRSPHHMIFATAWDYGLNDQRLYKYTSETRSWKLLELGKMNYWPSTLPNTVYWSGSLVCLVNPDMLVALDVEGEQIRELPPPPSPEGGERSRLRASGDRLHFIKVDGHGRFEILEMASESSGWHVLHMVDLSSDFLDEPFHLLAFIRGDADLLLLQLHGEIVSYHPQLKLFTTICDQVHPELHILFPLTQSVLPLVVSRMDMQQSNEWVCWKSEHDHLLISLMVYQFRNDKKMKNDFQIDTWREMVRVFNQATGMNYDVCHLKNRLKSYKREYQTVRKILAIDGFHWDPIEKVVNACYADWHKILKRISQALAYKRKQVPFEDLKIICASSIRIDSKVSQNTSHRKQKGRHV